MEATALWHVMRPSIYAVTNVRDTKLTLRCTHCIVLLFELRPEREMGRQSAVFSRNADLREFPQKLFKDSEI